MFLNERRATRRIANGAGVLIMLATLSGCGFHMQGASPLPKGIDAMHVSYHSNYWVGEPTLVAALRQRLRRQHLLGGEDAPAQLRINNVGNRTRVVSVSPINANTVERAITTRVKFTYRVNGKVKLAKTLSDTRHYTVSETERLSEQGERKSLSDEMQKDLADQILQRISMLSHKAGQ